MGRHAILTARRISADVQYLVDKVSLIPLWATFGVNLFLDNQITLGAKQGQPFHELQIHLHTQQEPMLLGRRDSNMHFKRDLDMMLKPNRIFTFDQNTSGQKQRGNSQQMWNS
jgi:hypothetical protein